MQKIILILILFIFFFDIKIIAATIYRNADGSYYSVCGPCMQKQLQKDKQLKKDNEFQERYKNNKKKPPTFKTQSINSNEYWRKNTPKPTIQQPKISNPDIEIQSDSDPSLPEISKQEQKPDIDYKIFTYEFDN